jgi:hypothetical protein
LGTAAGPITRTGRYYAESWRDYLSGEPRELPLARPSLALAAHAFRDEVTLLGLKARRPVSEPQAFARIEAEVTAALDYYGARHWLEHPSRFFAEPPRLATVAVTQASSFGRRYERLSFDSGYSPAPDEPGAERWHQYTGNAREYAMMLRHKEDRPWLICVHGAEMGRAALDLTLFRAWHLHHDLGLNVVLPVLPMHGPRARGLPRGVVFPNEDILNTLARHRTGSMGHPAPAVLDSGATAEVGSRPLRHLAGRLCLVIGRQPRKRPGVRHSRCPGCRPHRCVGTALRPVGG